MRCSIKFILFTLAFWQGYSSLGQKSPNIYEYDEEYSYGINFNTIGGIIGGFALKYKKYYKDNIFYGGEADAVLIKHPKEIRVQNQTIASSDPFIYRKLNYLMSLRLRGMIDYAVFPKGEDNAVEFSINTGLGPTLGFLKPYYVLYSDQNEGTVALPASDPIVYANEQNIQGNATFFEGFDELIFIPGLNYKLGLRFEFGDDNDILAGVEVGYLLDLYAERPNIMLATENPYYFHCFYLTLFYGNRN